MSQKFAFDAKEDFLHKLQELVQHGIARNRISLLMPYPLHEVDEILKPAPSRLRFFTLIGAVTGLIAGLLFTILTSLDWPLIGGGKPIVALPAYVIVAFELTILFGGLLSFLGFLILAGLPGFQQIIAPQESGNQFVIFIEAEEAA